ncbi:MAG TPA: hypothetical protein ENI66_01705 [Candidatus Yonathbacteria bacterium]|nr:hypothetical protein [Candidatus Yonathbacteria bacterium]
MDLRYVEIWIALKLLIETIESVREEALEDLREASYEIFKEGCSHKEARLLLDEIAIAEVHGFISNDDITETKKALRAIVAINKSGSY